MRTFHYIGNGVYRVPMRRSAVTNRFIKEQPMSTAVAMAWGDTPLSTNWHKLRDTILTITSGGHIIGWHEEGTYSRAYTQ